MLDKGFIRVKGGNLGLNTVLMMHLPAGLVGFVFQRAMKKGNLPRDIMGAVTDAAHLNREATGIFPRDVLNDSNRLRVELPCLKALENLF